MILWVLWCYDDSFSKCLHSPPFVHRNCSVCAEPWSEHDWWRWAWLKWCLYVKRMPWAHTGSTTIAAWMVSASGKDAHVKGLAGFWAFASVLHAGQRLHYCWQVSYHSFIHVFLFLYTDFAGLGHPCICLIKPEWFCWRRMSLTRLIEVGCFCVSSWLCVCFFIIILSCPPPGQPMKCNLHIQGNVITSDQPILL